jgi:LacI family transcriptional regulator
MKKLQLEDLAKKLGYSKTLISMVINGKGNHYGVSKKTQALVLDAVQQYDYRPNKFAKSLRTGKSHFVGLIVSDISNPFYGLIAKTIETLLFNKGYNLMVCSTEEEEDREKQMVEMMLEQQAVDGLIIASALNKPDFYDQDKFARVPMVFIDRVVPMHKGSFIVTDNYGGSITLVRHLLREGNKRIACLAITPLFISTIEDRLHGYREALLHEGVEDPETLIRPVRFEKIDKDVQKHLRDFVKNKNAPDAFYCLNNNIALALLQALHKKEFASLANVRVASFDDLPLFDLLDKKVVTVSQPVEEIGRSASALLLDMITGKRKDHANVVLPTRLVKR